MVTPPSSPVIVDCASCKETSDGHRLCPSCGCHLETFVVAWECGSCQKTNENMLRRHCHICGEQRPVRYCIVGGPIQPEFGGRRWFGKCAEPIDSVDESIGNDEHIKKGSCNNEGKYTNK